LGGEIATLLIANRGEIARRIQRTCRAMGIRTVAVFAWDDAELPFVRGADEAVPLAGTTPAETYLRADAIVDAARRTGADAVHPGYGFLAEDAAFAQRCEDAGLRFVGPPPRVLAAMGSKLEAKRTAERVGVPVLPTLADGANGARALPFPVLVKAAAGGGGRGMRVVEREADLERALESARREAESAFGDPTLFLEPYVPSPHHVEVQIAGDQHGTAVDLHERECSLQRRHQKVLEEAPSPTLDEDLRERLADAARRLAAAIGYVGVGTVEFIVGPDRAFFFLEVNARLQVEHPVTEAVTGVDLVRLQLEIAQGAALAGVLPERPPVRGHAIEARLCAEDPTQDWLPTAGRLHRLRWEAAQGLRVDAGYEDGNAVGVHYDSLLAKVIVHAPTRSEAARRLAGELSRFRIHGPRTNRDLLVRVLRHPEFLAGDVDTGFFARHAPAELGRPLAGDEAVRLSAVAAALAGQARRRSAAAVLASLPSGWRNVPSQPQRTRFRGHEVAYQFDRDRLWLAVDGDELPVDARISEAHCDLTAGGVQRRFEVAEAGGTWYVDSPLGAVELVETPRFADAGAVEAPGSLHAVMPGVVVRVSARPGEHVAAGQELLAVEAMKMERSVTAPHAGTLTELRVAPGQSVAAGELLAVIEESHEEEPAWQTTR
jgi:propionyl-CoA carboxylase alpha chain